MEPNNNGSSVLYMNGEPIGKLLSIPEITFAEPTEEPYILGVDLANGSDFTASIKLPHMSRKKFVSNLIKLGYSKKESKKIAWSVRKEGHCYASTYVIYAIERMIEA